MDKLFVYMFISRNKDNKNVDGFRKRVKNFLAYQSQEDEVFKAFSRFLHEGVSGETSRLYRSVNARDEQKTRKMLIARMVLEEPSMVNLEKIVASVASQVENRAESKWLFDFDCTDDDRFDAFLQDCSSESGEEDIVCDYCHTPNGWGVVVRHGFDCRNLLEKYSDCCSLKRDDMLLLASGSKM